MLWCHRPEPQQRDRTPEPPSGAAGVRVPLPSPSNWACICTLWARPAPWMPVRRCEGLELTAVVRCI